MRLNSMGQGLLLVLLLVAIAPMSVASATELSEVPTGAWVQIRERPSDGRRFFVHEGGLARIDAERVVLYVGGSEGERVIARENVVSARLRLREGRRMKGVGIGILSGFGLSLMMGLSAGDDESGIVRLDAGDKVVIFSAVFVPVGALIGAVVSPGARWESLSVSGVTLTPSIVDDRPGVALTLRF